MSAPALDITFIGTFAYIQPATSIQLADALPYFHAYQQYPGYVDGVMRIYDTGSMSGAPNNYCDIYVRIRTDGWMMAFFPDDAHLGLACWGTYPWILENYNNRGDLLWWGHTSSTVGNPPTQATRLGRALSELWDAVKTNSNNPSYSFDYTDVGYYDYEHTTATKIYCFGQTEHPASSITRYFYFTIPAGTNLLSGHANYGHYRNQYQQGASAVLNAGTENAYTIFSVGGIGASNGFISAAVTAYIFTEGVQNSVKVFTSANNASYYSKTCVGMILLADA